MGDKLMTDAQFHSWQSRMVPLMYDAFYHHNLSWPTQACRWGAKLDDSAYKMKYRLFFSEQTDGSEPNKLIAADVDVTKPHVCSAEVVSMWQEFAKCPYIKEQKVVYHAGEVNKIREIPQNPDLIVTHTDSKFVYLWNMAKQPSRAREKGKASQSPSNADLILTGHEDEAVFPLATSVVEPYVASGGSDHLVLLWSLQDSMETVLAGPGGKGKSPELAARTILKGHTATVEDVIFKPDSTQQLISVGDDHSVIFWDTRSGDTPATVIKEAHGAGLDIQCVDWEGQLGHLVATGAQDGSLRIWDTRKLGAASDCLAMFSGMHTGGIIRLEWHPHERGVFASGGEDKLINVWRVNPDAASGGSTIRRESQAGTPPPQELMFQHAGHRRGKVVDFQWHRDASLPWTMLSVSDDVEDDQIGGGSLQIWRINPLIYMDEDEAVAELEKHKDFIINGENPPQVDVLPKPAPAPTPEPAAAAAAAAGAGPGEGEKKGEAGAGEGDKAEGDKAEGDKAEGKEEESAATAQGEGMDVDGEGQAVAKEAGAAGGEGQAGAEGGGNGEPGAEGAGEGAAMEE